MAEGEPSEEAQELANLTTWRKRGATEAKAWRKEWWFQTVIGILTPPAAYLCFKWIGIGALSIGGWDLVAGIGITIVAWFLVWCCSRVRGLERAHSKIVEEAKIKAGNEERRKAERRRAVDNQLAKSDLEKRLAEEEPARALTAARGALRLRAAVYEDAWRHHIGGLQLNYDPRSHDHHDARTIIMRADAKTVQYLATLNHSLVSEFKSIGGGTNQRQTFTDTATMSEEGWARARQILLSQINWLKAKADSLTAADINDKKLAISLARLDAAPYQLVAELLPERVKPLLYLLKAKQSSSVPPSTSASRVLFLES